MVRFLESIVVIALHTIIRCTVARSETALCPHQAHKEISIAVYLQIGQHKHFDLIKACIDNTAAGKLLLQHSRLREAVGNNRSNHFCTFPVYTIRLNIHVTFANGINITELNKFVGYISARPGVDSVLVAHHTNEGFDLAPFLGQLNRTVAKGLSYDFALKIHSKSNRGWLKHTVDCLCGTAAQVASVLYELVKYPKLGMLAPQGTVFGPLSERIKVAPFLIKQLFSNQELWLAFEDPVIRGMDKLYVSIFHENISFVREEVVVVAGTMFWSRFEDLRPRNLGFALYTLRNNFSTLYRPDGGVEHLLERLIPSLIKQARKEVREMTPAPIPLLFAPTTTMQQHLCNSGGSSYRDHRIIVSYMPYSIRSQAGLSMQKRILCLSKYYKFALALNPGRVNYDLSSWENHFSEFLLPLFHSPKYIHSSGGLLFVLQNIKSLYSNSYSASESISINVTARTTSEKSERTTPTPPYTALEALNKLAQKNGFKGMHYLASVNDIKDIVDTSGLEIIASSRIRGAHNIPMLSENDDILSDSYNQREGMKKSAGTRFERNNDSTIRITTSSIFNEKWFFGRDVLPLVDDNISTAFVPTENGSAVTINKHENIKVNDVVYIKSASMYRGQQAKVMRYNKKANIYSKSSDVVKVRLTRYAGKPVLFVRRNEITAVSPDNWPLLIESSMSTAKLPDRQGADAVSDTHHDNKMLSMLLEINNFSLFRSAIYQNRCDRGISPREHDADPAMHKKNEYKSTGANGGAIRHVQSDFTSYHDIASVLRCPDVRFKPNPDDDNYFFIVPHKFRCDKITRKLRQNHLSHSSPDTHVEQAINRMLQNIVSCPHA